MALAAASVILWLLSTLVDDIDAAFLLKAPPLLNLLYVDASSLFRVLTVLVVQNVIVIGVLSEPLILACAWLSCFLVLYLILPWTLPIVLLDIPLGVLVLFIIVLHRHLLVLFVVLLFTW